MALWKPFRGNRTTLDAVEKHDGYVYFCVDDGSLFFDYIDAGGVLQRKQINAKDCESIMDMSLDELKAHIANQDTIVLTEAQAYTDQAIESAKADATNQDVVILCEAQAYTDAALNDKANSYDDTLTTTDKTIVGAINEINAKIAVLAAIEDGNEVAY